MFIFVDEIIKLIDMLILFIVLVALLAIVLFLRGEGGSYGKGNSAYHEKKNLSTSDKNFFL